MQADWRGVHGALPKSAASPRQPKRIAAKSAVERIR